MFFALFAWYCIQVHQTRFLLDVGFSPTTAAWALTLVSVTGIGGLIGLGHLSDRFGREWGWTAACAGYVICYALLLVLEHVPNAVLMYVMVAAQGLLGYGIAALFGSVSADLYPGPAVRNHLRHPQPRGGPRGGGRPLGGRDRLRPRRKPTHPPSRSRSSSRSRPPRASGSPPRARCGPCVSRNTSPMSYCGHQSACGSGPYSLKPLQRRYGYAFSVFRSVRPTTASILAPSRRTSVKTLRLARTALRPPPLRSVAGPATPC